MIEMWDECFAALNSDVSEALRAADGMRAFEAMHAILDAVWESCVRVLRPGGLICINIGDATRTVGGSFALYPNHARILQACLKLGLNPLPAIIWRKQTNAPNKFMGSGMLPAGAYVTLEHEYILILRKGDKRSFSSLKERAVRQESAFFWEERNQWFSDLWDFKGERQTIQAPEVARRSAAFPYELPFRLISMYSAVGDTVVDPFAGTGTTSAAAAALARNSVGYEIDPSICRVALDRVKTARQELNARNRKRLADHISFVADRQAKGKELGHVSDVYGFPIVTRQEREMRLHEVNSIGEERPGTLRVTYRPLEIQPALHEFADPSGVPRHGVPTIESWT